MKKLSLLQRVFSVRDIDCHYKVNLLGARMSFRHKMRVDWPEVNQWGLHAPARSPRLIASLTSIPKRMPTVHKVISALLCQKCQPDMLILWLAEEEFPHREGDLPEALLRLRAFGLTIRWCKNLRSYKKLVPALKEFPEDIIVTLDDDIYYAPDVLENLYAGYLKHPRDIQCYRTGRIRIENDLIVPIHNKVLMDCVYTEASFLNVIMSGTGTLFPPHSLHRDILDEDYFMKLIPTNDEIFFWAMAVLGGTRVRVTKGFGYHQYCISEAQAHALSHVNRPGGGGIDGKSALALMLKTYPQMLTLLKGEDEDA